MNHENGKIVPETEFENGADSLWGRGGRPKEKKGGTGWKGIGGGPCYGVMELWRENGKRSGVAAGTRWE